MKSVLTFQLDILLLISANIAVRYAVNMLWSHSKVPVGINSPLDELVCNLQRYADLMNNYRHN